MRTYRYLVIGGGIAGTTAAESIRQADPDGSIAIVSEEPHRLYSRVMLSKPGFFLGQIPFERIWLRKEAWYAEKKIDFIGGRTAVRLDPKEDKVLLDDGSTLGFEKLLVATGTCARKWGVPGAQKSGVHYLRTLDDVKGVMQAVKSAKHAVVIGGGFISFEMCEMFRLAGLDVTVILREKYFWEPLLDEESGRIVEKAFEAHSVKVVRSAEVAEVLGDKDVAGVLLKDGSQIPCDIILAGIGIFCASDWVQQGGVEISRGVLANEFLETNRPGIWAAGDAAEYFDIILGERTMTATWLNAQMQGKVAGLNMAGKKQPFRLVSAMSAQAFGIDVSFVGDAMPRPGRGTVLRGEPEKGSHARLVLKEEGIVGAVLVNRGSEAGAVAKVIEKNVDVSARLAELADSGFDLTSLLKP